MQAFTRKKRTSNNPQTAALLKQLAQLEKDGRKLDEAVHFFKDFMGSGRVSMDTLRQEMQHLQYIKTKLQATATELEMLEKVGDPTAAALASAASAALSDSSIQDILNATNSISSNHDSANGSCSEDVAGQSARDDAQSAYRGEGASSHALGNGQAVPSIPDVCALLTAPVSSDRLAPHQIITDQRQSTEGPLEAGAISGSATARSVKPLPSARVREIVATIQSLQAQKGASTPSSVQSSFNRRGLSASGASSVRVKTSEDIKSTSMESQAFNSACENTRPESLEQQQQDAAASDVDVMKDAALAANGVSEELVHAEVLENGAENMLGNPEDATTETVCVHITCEDETVFVQITCEGDVDDGKPLSRDALLALFDAATDAERLQKEVKRLQDLAASRHNLASELAEMQGKEFQIISLMQQHESRLLEIEALHSSEGKLLASLLEKEADLKVAHDQALAVKQRYDAMQKTVDEVAEMERLFSVLAPEASRLPVVREQVEALERHVREVHVLEQRLDQMHRVITQKPALQEKISQLQPQMHVVQALQSRADQLQMTMSVSEGGGAMSVVTSPTKRGGASGIALTNSLSRTNSLHVFAKTMHGLGREDSTSNFSRTMESVARVATLSREGSYAVPCGPSSAASGPVGVAEQPLSRQLSPAAAAKISRSVTVWSDDYDNVVRPVSSSQPVPSPPLAVQTPPTSEFGMGPAVLSGVYTARRVTEIKEEDEDVVISPSIVKSRNGELPELMINKDASHRQSMETSAVTDQEPAALTQERLSPFSIAATAGADQAHVSYEAERKVRGDHEDDAAHGSPGQSSVPTQELSQALHIEALSGLPSDLITRLHHVTDEKRKSEVALQELEKLEEHKATLEAKVSALRSSPAAQRVAELQRELFEMQQREVESLETQVQGMEGATERVAYLRQRLEELSAAEEEELRLEVAVQEAQELAAMKAQAAQQRAAAEAMEAELAVLESAATRLQTTASQQQELSQQLNLLRQQATQVEVLGREVASLAGVPVALAKLQSRHDTLQAKAAQLPSLESEITTLEEAAVTVRRLESRRSELKAAVASLPSLHEEVAALTEQLEAIPTMKANIQEYKTSLQEHAGLLEEIKGFEEKMVTLRQDRDLAAGKAAEHAALAAELTTLRCQADAIQSMRAEIAELTSSVQDHGRLSQQLATLRDQASATGDLEALQNEIAELTALVEEAGALKQEVAALQQQAAGLAELRERHAELLQEVTQIDILARDIDVLDMQADVVGDLVAEALTLGAIAEASEAGSVIAPSDVPSARASHSLDVGNAFIGGSGSASATPSVAGSIGERPAPAPTASPLFSSLYSMSSADSSAAVPPVPPVQPPPDAVQPAAANAKPVTHSTTLPTSVPEDESVEGDNASFAFPALKSRMAYLQELNASRRNSMDPSRRMSVDPSRRMSIDPNRRMSIDPNRRMSVDPSRRNSLSPGNVSATLDVVFGKLRVSEAKCAGLEAENEALEQRVDELTAALTASQGAVEKLRGLVAALGRIREAGSLGRS